MAEVALDHGIYRACRRAGLSERGWHVLRHSYAMHLAHFVVNPWRLQTWLGHSTINMTMRYCAQSAMMLSRSRKGSMPKRSSSLHSA